MVPKQDRTIAYGIRHLGKVEIIIRSDLGKMRSDFLIICYRGKEKALKQSHRYSSGYASGLFILSGQV